MQQKTCFLINVHNLHWARRGFYFGKKNVMQKRNTVIVNVAIRLSSMRPSIDIFIIFFPPLHFCLLSVQFIWSQLMPHIVWVAILTLIYERYVNSVHFLYFRFLSFLGAHCRVKMKLIEWNFNAHYVINIKYENCIHFVIMVYVRTFHLLYVSSPGGLFAKSVINAVIDLLFLEWNFVPLCVFFWVIISNSLQGRSCTNHSFLTLFTL